MENLKFYLILSAVDSSKYLVDQETIEADAFITENGGLDAYIELDEEVYLLSELVQYSKIDNCGFLKNIFKKAVSKVVSVVKETTQKVKDTAETVKDAVVKAAVSTVVAVEDAKNYVSDLMYDKTTQFIADNWKSVATAALIVFNGVVVAYECVAQTAEQLKAVSNYKYNAKLEEELEGVLFGNYIFNQYETDLEGSKCGDYKFGFTYFKEVGCEVAAGYNLMISLGKPEALSQTIFSYEVLGLEFGFAWGYYGSNSLYLWRFLENRNVNYIRYTDYNDFETAVSEKEECHLIVSRWNKTQTTLSKELGIEIRHISDVEFPSGYHTFYVKKINEDGETPFHACNFGSVAKKGFLSVDTLSKFNNGSSFICDDGTGFICGYLITGTHEPNVIKLEPLQH